VGTDHAVRVTAAGLVAEDLAGEISPPKAGARPRPARPRPPEPPADAANPFGLLPYTRAENEAWVREQGGRNPSDHRKVALWAIRFHEDEPESWARRVAELRAAVEALLRKHLAALEAAALRLYRDGGFVAGSLEELESEGETHGNS